MDPLAQEEYFVWSAFLLSQKYAEKDKKFKKIKKTKINVKLVHLRTLCVVLLKKLYRSIWIAVLDY